MGRKKEKKRKPREDTKTDPLTPAEVGAITYLAGRYIEELNPGEEDPWKQLFRIHPVTAEMKEIAQQLEQRLIEESKRGPGRPRKVSAAGRRHPDSLAVATAVRDYNVRHPGAMVKTGKRFRYSDDFRAFAVSLLAKGGLAQNMTLEEAALAIGMPFNTLAEWSSQGVVEEELEE